MSSGRFAAHRTAAIAKHMSTTSTQASPTEVY
jgi:hypothetical protein